MKSTVTFSLLASLVLLLSTPARAQTDASEVETLKRQFAVLDERVTELEAMRPTFTSFMPDFAERFHVMHRAGDAGDWAVASHELEDMRRMVKFSKYIDAERASLMEGMLIQNFHHLDRAIKHGNHKAFSQALGETINTCNRCHVATDSAFIQVTLEVDDALSLRHPHAFTEQAAPHGHQH